jgi:hypothetical protein
VGSVEIASGAVDVGDESWRGLNVQSIPGRTPAWHSALPARTTVVESKNADTMGVGDTSGVACALRSCLCAHCLDGIRHSNNKVCMCA